MGRSRSVDTGNAIIDDNAVDTSGMFGSFDRDSLKSAIDKTHWRGLAEHELVARLFEAFRQIEPVSVVLRLIDPRRFGIMSSPVQTVLGIRPRRKATATYEAYLKSLRHIREERCFDNVADVEMALWTLQLGVLDGLLPPQSRGELAKSYEKDAELRRIQAWNLTKQLFETAKLDVADALLTTEPAIAGQIAGIEFEHWSWRRPERMVGSGIRDSDSDSASTAWAPRIDVCAGSSTKPATSATPPSMPRPASIGRKSSVSSPWRGSCSPLDSGASDYRASGPLLFTIPNPWVRIARPAAVPQPCNRRKNLARCAMQRAAKIP